MTNSSSSDSQQEILQIPDAPEMFDLRLFVLVLRLEYVLSIFPQLVRTD